MAQSLYPDHWAENVRQPSKKASQEKRKQLPQPGQIRQLTPITVRNKVLLPRCARPDRPLERYHRSSLLHPRFIPVYTIQLTLSSSYLAPNYNSFKMDVKNAIDVFGVHDTSEKVQELGEKFYELSERSIETVISAAEALFYHAKTIWLFTYTDLKTIVGPETAFGILSALSGPILTTTQSPNLSVILSRTPRVAFWCWINLLPFAIDNQRQPEAIEEDGENKPWRSMPSRRLSETDAKWLMLSLYPAAIVASLKLGGLKQCLALVFLGWWYNDLGGANYSCITRNFINACGFLSYASGATEVASRSELLDSPFKPTAWPWFLIIGAIVFTSVQTQDMYDQPGDSLRGRKTVPLVVGDHYARLSIAIAMTCWSVVCPTFWHLGPGTYAMSMITGAIVTFRTLTKRSVPADKLTFRIWNLWMVILYLMPLFKRIQGDSWL